MSLSNSTNLNITSFASDVNLPTSGNYYNIQSVGYGHCLTNDYDRHVDDNPIVAWNCLPPRQDELWTYLTYPSTNGDIVFTLQVESILQSSSSAVIDGRGGYMRVDPKTNKIVQGGQPQAWKLVQVTNNGFKIVPFDDVYSNGEQLALTDVQKNVAEVTSQAQLTNFTGALTQLWTFQAPA